MSHSAVRIESVVLRRGQRTVLQIPHLAVEKGQILSVIGPNGAGKSTLLQVMGLLRKPSEGRVFFDGQEVPNSSGLVALRRRMALVFQEPLLFRGAVSDNVALGLRLRKVRRSEIKQRVELWLAKLNITHLASQSVSKLSVGEAQRVNLARSLVLDPELFLLDEPFAALDPPTQALMTEELQTILTETRTTTVVVTQNRAEALMLSNRLAVMMEGKIAQIDRPENVFSHPANEVVAAFLGIETVGRGRVLSSAGGLSTVAMADHPVMVAGTYSAGEQFTFCVRPEDITILLPSQSPVHGSEVNVLRGIIERVTPLETQFKVFVNCGFPATVLVSKQAFIDLSLAKGKQVLLAFKPSAVHVIPNSRES